MAFRIVLFYKYTSIPKPSDFVATQHALCTKLGITGRLLVGAEGINGTLSCPSSSSGLHDWIDYTSSLKGFEDVDWKLSEGNAIPFECLTVKVVNEIVATGNSSNLEVGDIAEYGGRHLSPHEFHSSLSKADSDTVLIDVRNTFEHAIGHFTTGAGLSAIEPKMQAFTEFDAWCEQVAPSLKNKKVLMYCTGGIRCEKASCMLTKRGVEDVSQLEGGIHRYMDAFPDVDKGSLWRGKNFVFDNRVAVSTSAPPKPSPSDILPDVAAGDDGAGHATEEGNTVVGKCVECHVKYDVLSGNRICALCRDLVLVCPRCATLLREYHCNAHQGLKHAFFSFLDDFTVEELEEQRSELAKVVPPRGPRKTREKGATGNNNLQVENAKPLNANLEMITKSPVIGAHEAADVGFAGGGLTFPAASKRDVVRACRKQIKKLDAAIERAKRHADATEGATGGAGSGPGGWQTRCRSCGLQEIICSKSRVGTLTRCAAKRL